MNYRELYREEVTKLGLSKERVDRIINLADKDCVVAAVNTFRELKPEEVEPLRMMIRRIFSLTPDQARDLLRYAEQRVHQTVSKN